MASPAPVVISKRQYPINIPVWEYGTMPSPLSASPGGGFSENSLDAVLCGNKGMYADGALSAYFVNFYSSPSALITGIAAIDLTNNITARAYSGLIANRGMPVVFANKRAYAASSFLGAGGYVYTIGTDFSLTNFVPNRWGCSYIGGPTNFAFIGGGDTTYIPMSCFYIDALGDLFRGTVSPTYYASKIGVFVGGSILTNRKVAFRISNYNSLNVGLMTNRCLYPSARGSYILTDYSDATNWQLIAPISSAGITSSCIAAVPDDPIYTTAFDYGMSVCPMGFLIRKTPLLSNAGNYILSPDGSKYWPINFIAQSASMAALLSTFNVSVKIDLNGTCFVADYLSVGGKIGSNVPPGGFVPQMGYSPAVIEGYRLNLNSLPCYDYCVNPPISIGG